MLPRASSIRRRAGLGFFRGFAAVGFIRYSRRSRLRRPGGLPFPLRERLMPLLNDTLGSPNIGRVIGIISAPRLVAGLLQLDEFSAHLRACHGAARLLRECHGRDGRSDAATAAWISDFMMMISTTLRCRRQTQRQKLRLGHARCWQSAPYSDEFNRALVADSSLCPEQCTVSRLILRLHRIMPSDTSPPAQRWRTVWLSPPFPDNPADSYDCRVAWPRSAQVSAGARPAAQDCDCPIPTDSVHDRVPLATAVRWQFATVRPAAATSGRHEIPD